MTIWWPEEITPPDEQDLHYFYPTSSIHALHNGVVIMKRRGGSENTEVGTGQTGMF